MCLYVSCVLRLSSVSLVYLCRLCRDYVNIYMYKFECDAGHNTTRAKPEVKQEHDVRGGTTIEVYGLDPSTTDDAISMFFENERLSGGGDVDNVQFDPDRNVAYVTFYSRDGGCLVEHL